MTEEQWLHPQGAEEGGCMTSGGAGAAATEAAISLSWKTGPGASLVPAGAWLSLCESVGLLHLCRSRLQAGKLLVRKLRLLCWDLMH